MFSFLALHVLAAAVIVSPSPTPTPLRQIAHVVTADRSDETLHNTVRTTYVVTAADIARNGYRTVSDALATVPGVDIESYGPIGASAGYGIRGTSSAETLVLIDGLPAPGGLSDSVQLGTMSTAGVARIEVVEGGGSTLYGQGSVGGIINIITDGSKTPPSATLAYGTFNDREVRAEADGLSFEHINADNAFGLPASGNGNPAERANSDYNENVVRYGLDRALGALRVTLRASLGDDDLGADGDFPYYSSTSREHDVNEDLGLNFSLRGAQSDPTLSLFGTRQLTEYGCLAGADPECFQSGQSLETEARTGLSLRNVVNGSSERLIYGADFSRGNVLLNDGYGDPVSAYPLAQSAAYAQETWISARSEFYAGVRGERDGVTGGEFSPSAGARFDLGEGVQLKLNAATAFRAPNATELFYPGYGSVVQGLGYLQPERAKVGDVTLSDTHVLGGASIGWFDNYTRDLIVTACVADCGGNAADYAPQNVDQAHIEGLTFDAQTLPFNGIRATLNTTDLYLAQDLDAQSRLPNDAVFSVNVGLRWNGAPNAIVHELGISERAVGSRGYVDPTPPAFSQPIPYSILTAYVQLRIAPRALLTVRGDNLGNERYAEIAGYPMPGRTLRIELSTLAPEQR